MVCGADKGRPGSDVRMEANCFARKSRERKALMNPGPPMSVFVMMEFLGRWDKILVATSRA